jgi:proteasome lid subunit RPN8/RPN11
MRFCLQIPQGIHDDMVKQALVERPHECVGLLAGTPDGRVAIRLPLVNALADPRRFLSEPRSLFEAERRRRELGLEFLAVYHSHPTGPAEPSHVDTDPDVNYWVGEQIVFLIISLAQAEPEVKGYWLAPGRFAAAELEIVMP